MSKKEIIMRIIENNPRIENNCEYVYQIICYETRFKDYIYFNKNNSIKDITNIKKPLKYYIKLMKKGKILGVGNIIIGNDIFVKKIKKKIYNNINIFITENNYRKIFRESDDNKKRMGIKIGMEVNINYKEIIENEKEKNRNKKKIKLIKRNLSFQNNEYSMKSSSNNYLTTYSSNVNTLNNLKNLYEWDNYNESNINYFSSNNITPSYIINPSSYSPFTEPNQKNKKMKMIKNKIISSISFKNNKNKNKNIKIFSNNINYDIFDLKDNIKLSSSRNKKFLFNKNKINIIMSKDTSSSKTSNSITQSSIIDSTLLENDNYKINNNIEINNKIKNYNGNVILNDETYIINNNNNKYNIDNDDIDNYIINIEKKKNKVIKEIEKENRKLFNQEMIYKKINGVVNNYGIKIDNYKYIINKLTDKIEIFKSQDDTNNVNKDIINIITKVKESKEIENNIINIIIKNGKNKEESKSLNTIENNIKKYNKNLMIKIMKNVIQNNDNNPEKYLSKENNEKLKEICKKYNIFGSIIEENED